MDQFLTRTVAKLSEKSKPTKSPDFIEHEIETNEQKFTINKLLSSI